MRSCFTLRLSVCLSAASHRNYRSYRHDKFTRCVFFNKEELNKFWKASFSGSGSRFFKIFFNILRWVFFPQFGSYLWKNRYHLRENFIIDVSTTKFGKSWGSRIWTKKPDLPWQKYALIVVKEGPLVLLVLYWLIL